MEFDTSNLNDEDITKISDFIYSLKKEKETQKKWWIMPNFDCFEQYNSSIGLNYFVEEQKDSYSKSRPPLKSDFNSKEEAEEWLKNYLKKEEIFKSAQNDIDNLYRNLNDIYVKLLRHEYITNDDWKNCFRLFNESRLNGDLNKVTTKE